MKQFLAGVFLTVIAVIVIDIWSSGRLPSYDEVIPPQTAVTPAPEAENERVEIPFLLATPDLATIAPPTLAPVVEPTAVNVAPTAIPASPTVMVIDPTRDWSGEIIAVNRNFSNAINLYEACAFDTAKAMQTFSEKPDCTAVDANLERARGMVKDLQAQMREDGQ